MKWAAIFLIAAALIVGGAWWWWRDQSSTRALTHAVQQAGQQTVAAGQAQAQTATLRIVTDAQARDRGIAATHEENVHALAQAPGAADVLDPGFVQQLDRGLCLYAASRDDPGCAAMRGSDPTGLPPAGGGDAPPTPGGHGR